MNIIKHLWALICPLWAFRLGFGGDSESSQTTENTDARVVGGDNSQNSSIKAGGDVIMTDRGAVSDSLALARRGVEAVENTAKLSVGTTADMLAGVLKSTESQQGAFTSALQKIETKDTTTLIYAGMAVIGLAAAAFFGKRAT